MIERSEPTAINGDCGLVKKTLNLMTGRLFFRFINVRVHIPSGSSHGLSNCIFWLHLFTHELNYFTKES